jgi:hypothetical protein
VLARKIHPRRGRGATHSASGPIDDMLSCSASLGGT